MDAKSGSGSSGNFLWGLIAGIAALIGAGGLYLSGIFGDEQDTPVPQQTELAAEAPQEDVTKAWQATQDQKSKAGRLRLFAAIAWVVIPFVVVGLVVAYLLGAFSGGVETDFTYPV